MLCRQFPQPLIMKREEAPIWKTSSPVCILYMIPYVFPVTSLIISKDRYNVSGCFGISTIFCDFIRYYSNCLDVKAYNWKNCNRLVNAPLGTAKACARLKFTGAPYNRERFVIFDKREAIRFPTRISIHVHGSHPSFIGFVRNIDKHLRVKIVRVLPIVRIV